MCCLLPLTSPKTPKNETTMNWSRGRSSSFGSSGSSATSSSSGRDASSNHSDSEESSTSENRPLSMIIAEARGLRRWVVSRRLRRQAYLPTFRPRRPERLDELYEPNHGTHTPLFRDYGFRGLYELPYSARWPASFFARTAP